MAKKTEKSSDYKITIQYGDDIIVGKGATMLEALAELKTPVKIIAKAFVTLEQGNRQYKTMLFPARSKRIFHKIARITLAKQFELLLK